jgi:hypothetical protein
MRRLMRLMRGVCLSGGNENQRSIYKQGIGILEIERDISDAALEK